MQIVWASFVCAMTVVCGVLLVANGWMPALKGGPVLGPSEVLGGSTERGGIFDLQASIDPGRWKAIVIHHSGSAGGDAAQIDRLHRGWGLDGLGYHFVIGNGNGMADGGLHMGYRWVDQHAGLHVIGPDREWHNRNSIAICLIGNGNARPFTTKQMQVLRDLVRELQERFSIPADRVLLHRNLAAEVSSPGAYFAEAEFRSRLLSITSQ